ncbi:MAG: TerB N-terminal domain-containing protein [Lachnospiraceae bacterium]|nr:TerB N-terminal domain-containing protein [Lachnospiraceae bacterium]
MELAELTAYAREKYNIEEEHKWADFPGFSVLTHPRTGKWVALLMRQWDTDSGTQIERCDIKCGRQSLSEFEKPYLTVPIRMQGQKWIDAAFDRRTEPEVIFALFDRAVAAEDDPGYARGATIILRSRYDTEAGSARNDTGAGSARNDTGAGSGRDNTGAGDAGTAYAGEAPRTYEDTPLPFAGSKYRPAREEYPEKLRRMRSLFHYGWESRSEKAKHFYLQGKFMEDYEDDAPLPEYFICYYPTYQDLTTKQLRGYFTWRTLVRRGEFEPVTTSAAYIYVYELLNGIGASTPEESLQKLKEFEEGFLDADKDAPPGRMKDLTAMRRNLHRWMLEFAVVRGLDPETVRRYADAELVAKDAALSVLREPDRYTDDEVFDALCRFGGKKTAQTPVLTNDPEKGKRLFAEAWRAAAAGYRQPKGDGNPEDEGKDLFTLCFGTRKKRQWFPLANAVYHESSRHRDVDLLLDESRSYHCRNGVWRTEGYEDLFFDRNRFQGFWHETDMKLRRYLKTGRYLKERPEDAWAAPFIDAVIEADKKAVIEASRPKITIDLEGLEQIRRDASKTRDSLLTDEERLEALEYSLEYPTENSMDYSTEYAAEYTEEDTAEFSAEEFAETAELPAELSSELQPDISPDIPLDAVQIRILQLLLLDEPEAVKALVRENHLMPALATDLINEALYDEIGDIVLTCEDDRLSLVEDYKEDIARMVEGI